MKRPTCIRRWAVSRVEKGRKRYTIANDFTSPRCGKPQCPMRRLTTPSLARAPCSPSITLPCKTVRVKNPIRLQAHFNNLFEPAIRRACSRSPNARWVGFTMCRSGSWQPVFRRSMVCCIAHCLVLARCSGSRSRPNSSYNRRAMGNAASLSSIASSLSITSSFSCSLIG